MPTPEQQPSLTTPAPSAFAAPKRKYDPEAIRAYARKIQEAYITNSVTDKANFLIYGEKGMGKSTAILTAPRPIHMDVFDSGGTKAQVFKDAVREGWLIIDNRWEHDSWKNPFAFRAWESEHRTRKASGYYDTLGTYALDSVSTFSDSMMYAILKVGSKTTGPRPGTNPEIQDYGVQQMSLVDYMNDLMYLPCNVIVTGHIDLIKDEVLGSMKTALLLAGKAANKTAIPFDEQYVAHIVAGQHKLLTQNDGRWQATTRIGSGVFLKEEDPNIRALLKKAGFPYEDKVLEG